MTLKRLLTGFVIAVGLVGAAAAQDGTIYPLDAPEEPNAILLGTGGVEGQTANES